MCRNMWLTGVLISVEVFNVHADSMLVPITKYFQNPSQTFVPLGITVYGNPPAFYLTEFSIWNFDVQGQFWNPDLHLQLSLQVTICEVHQHSDPSPHLFAIHVDVITPVWYLREEKRLCQWWRGEKRTGNWSFQDTIVNFTLPKSIQCIWAKDKVYLKWIDSEIWQYYENILLWRAGFESLWKVCVLV